ncbi:hypothetical protein OH492_28710 [Vibrio chagasii]|nr:hypothetical protein [Vibrio chagasii]
MAAEAIMKKSSVAGDIVEVKMGEESLTPSILRVDDNLAMSIQVLLLKVKIRVTWLLPKVKKQIDSDLNLNCLKASR